MRQELLPERVSRRQLAQFGDQLAVPARGQIGLDALLQRGEPRHFRGREPRGQLWQAVGHVKKRGAAPEIKSLAQQRSAGHRIRGQAAPSGRAKITKAVPVELAGRGAQQVAGRAAGNSTIFDGTGSFAGVAGSGTFTSHGVFFTTPTAHGCSKQGTAIDLVRDHGGVTLG
jgi:hypothetical protein